MGFAVITKHRRRVAVTVLVIGWISLWAGVGVSELRWHRNSVDLTRRCAPGHVSGCLSREPGLVTGVDGNSIALRYADGTRTRNVDIRGGAAPETGTRVILERWSGTLVSVAEVRSERRYHTFDWPSTSEGILFAAIAAVIALGGVGLGWSWLRDDIGEARGRRTTAEPVRTS